MNKETFNFCLCVTNHVEKEIGYENWNLAKKVVKLSFLHSLSTKILLQHISQISKT